MLTKLLAIPAAQQCMLCLIKLRPMSQMICSSNTLYAKWPQCCILRLTQQIRVYSLIPVKLAWPENSWMKPEFHPPLMFPIFHYLLWTSHFALCLLHHWGQVFPAHFLWKPLNECNYWSLRSPIQSASNAPWITAELSRWERRKINDCRAPSQCIMPVPLLSIPTGCYSKSLTNSCPCIVRQPWHSCLHSGMCTARSYS